MEQGKNERLGSWMSWNPQSSPAFAWKHFDLDRSQLISTDTASGGSSLVSCRWLVGTIVVLSAVLLGVKAWVDDKYLKSGERVARKVSWMNGAGEVSIVLVFKTLLCLLFLQPTPPSDIKVSVFCTALAFCTSIVFCTALVFCTASAFPHGPQHMPWLTKARQKKRRARKRRREGMTKERFRPHLM